MTKENKNPNAVVPEGEGEPITPAAVVTPPVVTPDPEPNPAEVPPAVPETPPAPAPEPNDDNPMVPRGRLNEEIRKRHELEERIKALESTPKPSAVLPPTAPQKDNLDILAEQMSEEAGQDDFGNPMLSVKAAKVVLLTQARIQHATTAGARLDANVAEYVKKNPNAAPYADKIRAELSTLEPGVKDNPINVERKFKELRGSDVDRLVAEAEERGRLKAIEHKKIITQASGERPGSLPDGKTAGDMLNSEEKAFADKHKMSYEDYYKNKSSKRV